MPLSCKDFCALVLQDTSPSRRCFCAIPCFGTANKVVRMQIIVDTTLSDTEHGTSGAVCGIDHIKMIYSGRLILKTDLSLQIGCRLSRS